MKKAEIITLVLVILTAAALLMQFSGTDAEYSRFNMNWNGTSDFFTAAQASYIYDYHDLPAKTNTTLLVISPSENFGGDELIQYVRNGNVLIIADQSGNANAFLEDAGSDIRVVPEHLRSSDWEYRYSELFRAYMSKYTLPLWEEVFYLFVNRPAYLTGGIPFIETSRLSWIDLNGDNIADADEPLLVYSVASYNIVENGYIIVISDPSIFINSMQNIQYTENRAFINDLIAQDLYIDQTASHTADGDGLFGLLPLIYRYPAVCAGILAGLFLLCGLICLRRGKS